MLCWSALPSQHFIRACRARLAAAVILLVAARALLIARPQPSPGGTPTSTFVIFLRAERIGSEDVAVTRTPSGWTITSSGSSGPPLNLAIRQVQVRYSLDWKPIDLKVDATVSNQPLVSTTTVNGGTATTTTTQGTQTSERSDAMPDDAVLLPSPFWGPFEALAQRLRTSQSGAIIPGWVPGGAFQIQVGETSDETIQTASQIVRAHRTMVKLLVQGTALDVEVWGDDAGHLLRLSVPLQNLEVAREDIASVNARLVTVSRPNDEQVKVPANGFSLAGTLSKPAGADGRPRPGVILVPGSGPTDRDETVFGIPIFGQLAGALADAGFSVLRYDKRGVGQSGGRIESATMADYADDLRAAVKFMSERKDVDKKRIAVVGHSEGGSVAMLAAAKEKKIAALGLVSTIGTTGAELNMAQVRHALERAKRPEPERQATIDLQQQIQDAVLTGKGWEGVPPALRKQADVPWFHSFLAFDPARLMNDVRQPLLIVQGQLDTQVHPSNADRLEALARARKKAAAVEIIRVPGVNHLLVPATTGELDEYGTLKDKQVSPAVTQPIVAWLKKTFGVS
jgi:pimeloyl-ACP methyl ester carboxylesterase